MPRTRKFTKEAVVDAAIGLIEADGLEALTMRRLGRTLGVEGMALYTYFRGKDELLDAVAERILEGLDTNFDRSAPWQSRIRRGALSWARLQEAHPRGFPLVYRGSLRTDAVELLTEELFDALRAAGFDAPGAALAYQSVVTLIDAALLGRSSSTDADVQAAWRRIARDVDPTRYPRIAEVSPHSAALTWTAVLDSGLDLLLRGLERRLPSCVTPPAR